jgi:hypothetical protein
MGLDVKVLSFNIGTGAAGTTVTVSPGFQTKAGILWWSGRTETINAAGNATHLRGMGFFTSSVNMRSVCSRDGHGIGTAVTACGHRADMVVFEINASDAFVGQAEVDSIDATDVVFLINTQFVTNLRVTGLFLGGSDITAVEIGTFLLRGSAGAQNIPTTNPLDAVFLLAGPHQSDAPVVVVDSTFMFGAGVGVYDGVSVKTGAVVLGGANDGSTSGSSGTYGLMGECLALHSTLPANSPNHRAEYWGSDATVDSGSPGFQLSVLEGANSHRIHYLGITGCRWSLHEILTQTDTTTDIVISGLGYPPAAGIVASSCKAETVADAVPAANDEISIGAFTSTSERAGHGVASLNGNTNMFVATAYRTDAVYANLNPSTGAVEGLMDVKSMDSGGVTFIMDDADPAQAWGFVALVAANATAAAFMPPQPRVIAQSVNRASTF